MQNWYALPSQTNWRYLIEAGWISMRKYASWRSRKARKFSPLMNLLTDSLLPSWKHHIRKLVEQAELNEWPPISYCFQDNGDRTVEAQWLVNFFLMVWFSILNPPHPHKRSWYWVVQDCRWKSRRINAAEVSMMKEAACKKELMPPTVHFYSFKRSRVSLWNFHSSFLPL